MPHHKKLSRPSILLLQGSTHPNAHTALLLEEIAAKLLNRCIIFSTLDLRSADLDLFDGRPLKEYGDYTKEALERIKQAHCIFFSIPAFAPQVPRTLRNLVDLSAPCLEGKRAGVISYSETGSNYPASLDFIRLLSSHGVEILQPIVRATHETFREGKIFDDVVPQLIDELIDAALTPSL